MDYYKPRTKKDLALWLVRRYPYASFKGMDIKRMWSIFYNTVRRHENGT